jgi:hypothetical protein
VLALSTMILPSSAMTAFLRISASASFWCAAKPRSTNRASARVLGTFAFFLLLSCPSPLAMAAPRSPFCHPVARPTGAGRTTAGAKQHGASPPAWQPAKGQMGVCVWMGGWGGRSQPRACTRTRARYSATVRQAMAPAAAGAPRSVSDQVTAVLAARELAEFSTSANNGEHAPSARRAAVCLYAYLQTHDHDKSQHRQHLRPKKNSKKENAGNRAAPLNAGRRRAKGAMGIKQLTKLIGDQAPDAIKVSGSRGHVPLPHGPRRSGQGRCLLGCPSGDARPGPSKPVAATAGMRQRACATG